MPVADLSGISSRRNPATDKYAFNERIADFDLIADHLQYQADFCFAKGEYIESELIQHRIYLKAEKLIKVYPPYDSYDLKVLEKIEQLSNMIIFLSLQL